MRIERESRSKSRKKGKEEEDLRMEEGGDQRNEVLLLPSLLFWPHSPPFSPHSLITTQGNQDGKEYKNGQESTTVAEHESDPMISLPFTRHEHSDTRSVPINEYGGGQGSLVPLQTELVEKERIYYVNPKQYHAILRRRLSRAKREASMRERARKKYLHESRHLHAMRRARGSGGRFLNTKTQNLKTTINTSNSVNHQCFKFDGSAMESRDLELERIQKDSMEVQCVPDILS